MNADDHLHHLRTRRSVREFTAAPVARATLERVVDAALTAPSASNRQPWRFTVVTAAPIRAVIVAAVKARTEAIDQLVSAGPHAVEWGRYSDHFWQPLASAPVIIVPSVRELPDTIASYLRSSGADPERFPLPSAMQPERSALGGAVIALLLQAHAEGLGAAWMAGPMVAKPELEAWCGIAPPWHAAGAIALGHPAAIPDAPPRRAPEHVVRWIDEEDPS